MRAIWQVLPPAPPDILQAGQNLIGGSPLLAQLLYNRRIPFWQWEAFLVGDSRLSASPFLLPDLYQGVSRLYRALLSGEKIAVYGDYDTDGVTATALLVQGLRSLGAELIPYIPHRQEGHGLQISVLERLHRQGASLVITADCGTTCYQEVEAARRRGQDIIITDHHTPGEVLPPTVALINPKHPESGYPFRDLAGVAVAYKFLHGLFLTLGREDPLLHFFDLIALGTVTDVAPLNGENRYLVKEGLRALNRAERPGLQELIRLAGLKPGGIDTDAIAWVLGPRLNAAGRVEHADLAYQLLVTGSSEEGKELAQELEARNTERHRQVEIALQKAREMAREQKDAPLILVASQEFSAGVAGLVANKLVDEFHRPAVVVRWGPESCRGSCRTVPEFDLMAALKGCAPLLSRYGGHPMAAGFNVSTEKLDELRQRLQEEAQRRLEGVDLRPQLAIDAELPLDAINGAVVVTCQKLSPFGQGNPPPAFLSRRVKVVKARRIGANGDHLRLKLRGRDQGGAVWDAIAFNAPEIGEPPYYLDAVYTLEASHWGNQDRLELHLLDFQPAT